MIFVVSMYHCRITMLLGNKAKLFSCQCNCRVLILQVSSDRGVIAYKIFIFFCHFLRELQTFLFV